MSDEILALKKQLVEVQQRIYDRHKMLVGMAADSDEALDVCEIDLIRAKLELAEYQEEHLR